MKIKSLEKRIARAERVMIALSIAAIAIADYAVGPLVSLGPLYLIPLCYAALSQHQRAVDDFSGAIALAPQVIAYLVDRGRSLEALGRTSDALADYRAATTMKAVSVSDVLMQGMARVRINALGGGTAPGKGECTKKGQTCL